MKILVAGAGDVGFHLAQLLSHQNEDIVLIDTNTEVLEYAQSHVDVKTVRGDSSSLEVLNEADVADAKLFLAVTTSEKNNLISCILAKKLGAKYTIARVNNPEYLNENQLINFQELGIDHLISPLELAVHEIQRLVKHSEVTDNFEFEEGKVIMYGLTVDDDSPLRGKSIEQIDLEFPDVPFHPFGILRHHDTIIPQRNTVIKNRDHIYFLSDRKKMNNILKVFKKDLQKMKSIMIVGGNQLGMRTAKALEKNYKVVIIEKDREVCRRLTEELNHSLIIKGDPSNIEVLKEEGLEQMDAFIALTPNSEINIITSLVAEEEGVYKTIASVENMDYTHISQNIGIDTMINKKLIAANNIFRFIRKGKVEAITSPHGVEAEIIEYLIDKDSYMTSASLKDLKLPKKVVIGAVIRNNSPLQITDDLRFQINDKVIIFALPEAIDKVQKLFS